MVGNTSDLDKCWKRTQASRKIVKPRTGIFYPGPWLAGGTERHLLALASVMSHERVEVLTFSPAPQAKLTKALGLDLSGVRFRLLPEMAADELSVYTAAYDLWLNASPWHPIPSRSARSVYLVVYPPVFGTSAFRRIRRAVAVRLRSAAKRTALGRILSRAFPGLARRLDLVSVVSPQDALTSYQVIIANSEFTRAVIRQRWGRESHVLYPPVDTDVFQPRSKRQMILSVGRFGRGGNNKKHLALIEAFRGLVDDGLQGWELHLAGSTHDDAWNRAYFDQVMQAAAGYPISIHADSGYDELRRLYGESALYWHGAGYGEDQERHPLHVEHFGITTVEAMAAGCIPIVCGKGGQPEIVSHGVHGFLWTNLEELKRHTRQVIDDPGLAARLRTRAIERSQRFGMAPFAARLREILGVIDHPRPAFSGRH